MVFDHALILSAGQGTRMGNVGRILPKVLWPVFEKSLIEMQSLYAKTFFRPNKIFANTHFQRELIRDFCVDHSLGAALTLVEEKDVLDIGGAIHHFAGLAEVQYSGTLLAANGDQFLFFSPELLSSGKDQLKKYPVVLIATEVQDSSGYNEILVDEEGCLTGIIKADERKGNGRTGSYLTYSGTCMMDLEKIGRYPGRSAFFESVGDYRNRRIKVLRLPLKQYEYWDFGTVERFQQSSFQLMRDVAIGKKGAMLDFCIKNGAFLEQKLSRKLLSYGDTDNGLTINLSQKFFPRNGIDRIIILGDAVGRDKDLPGIYYRDEFSPI